MKLLIFQVDAGAKGYTQADLTHYGEQLAEYYKDEELIPGYYVKYFITFNNETSGIDIKLLYPNVTLTTKEQLEELHNIVPQNIIDQINVELNLK